MPARLAPLWPAPRGPRPSTTLIATCCQLAADYKKQSARTGFMGAPHYFGQSKDAPTREKNHKERKRCRDAGFCRFQTPVSNAAAMPVSVGETRAGGASGDPVMAGSSGRAPGGVGHGHDRTAGSSEALACGGGASIAAGSAADQTPSSSYRPSGSAGSVCRTYPAGCWLQPLQRRPLKRPLAPCCLPWLRTRSTTRSKPWPSCRPSRRGSATTHF